MPAFDCVGIGLSSSKWKNISSMHDSAARQGDDITKKLSTSRLQTHRTGISLLISDSQETAYAPTEDSKEELK